MITFAQSLGLLVLSKILLGGFHKHGHGGGGWQRKAWQRRMQKRWAKMTPEERERFRAGMRSRWNCRPGFRGEGFRGEGFPGQEAPVEQSSH
jgi:hypothetical protein